MPKRRAADANQGVARRDRILLALAFAAGCVDALSYLGLSRVFTANMTGNAVLLGLAIGQTEELQVAHSSAAIVGFILGVVVAAKLVGPPR
ncbi:MAG TPA: YoaK family protein, partial [Methylomirabilota bacterium]